jgi:hypothetical protein
VVAYYVLQPVLRSRGKITTAAQKLSDEEEFRENTVALLSGEPTGRLALRTLQDDTTGRGQR